MAVTHSLDLETSSSQYASNAATNCNITTSQTWECWLNVESAGNWYPMGICNVAGSAWRGINLTASNEIQFVLTAIAPNFVKATTLYTLGTWFHVAGVYDSSGNTFKIYVNGELEATQAVTGSSPSITSDFAIGRLGSFNGYYYDGKIRNARIWNDVRTQDEIRNNMNIDTPADTTNLQGNWLLNNNYTDSSSNGYNLTASGSPTFSTTYPDALDLTENGTYLKKHKITIDNTKVSGSSDLTDVPIVLTEDNFLADAFSNSLNGGADIRFSTDIDGKVRLAHEIVTWNTGTSVAEVHVKINTLSYNTDTDIYCYSPDTEIMTENGWKNIKDLVSSKQQIKIATLNVDTNSVEYKYPDKYLKVYHDGKLFHQTGKNVDFLVTPNHKVLAKRKNYSKPFRNKTKWKDDWELIPAEELPKNVAYKKDFPNYKGEEIENFILPAYKNEYNVKSFKQTFFGGKIGERSSYKNNSNRIEKRYKMDAFLKFLGIWLGDGSKRKTTVIISQKKTHTLEEIKSCISELGYKPYYTGTDFLIHDVQLVEWLKQFGHAHDKFIPQEIKNLSKRQLQILLDGLMLADGTVQNGGMAYASVSKQLADDVQEIALKIGYNASINKRRFTDKRWIHKTDGIYIVSISKGKDWTNPYNSKNSNQEWIDYKGYVYCVDVPNHIVYTRRNNKASWNGNCHYNNSAATAIDENEAFGKHQVWGENWEGVWHLNETSGTRVDATKNSYDLTDNNTVLSGTGKLGTAADFELTNSEYLNAATSFPSLTSSWYVGAWVKRETTGATHAFYSRMKTTTTERQLYIYISSSNKVVVDIPYIKSILTSTGTVDTNYHFIAVVKSGTTWSIYIDGSLDSSVVDAQAQEAATTTSPLIGKFLTDYMDGLMDEFMIYNNTLSADYIATLYNNQNSPSTFATPSALGSSAFFMFL